MGEEQVELAFDGGEAGARPGPVPGGVAELGAHENEEDHDKRHQKEKYVHSRMVTPDRPRHR
ncbi:hypothetical protein Aca07nite_27530 [Actinoplanes capillaceus]|uniref:Uncharacterized protein n=1 Tax=Actinoplanes campanulatus TaxID=113559 RepID=A0ABQ3WGV4_9ACTN|nr:hypothetical protein Aca07nite_27530 [Actinoplanes capillaceus]